MIHFNRFVEEGFESLRKCLEGNVPLKLELAGGEKVRVHLTKADGLKFAGVIHPERYFAGKLYPEGTTGYGLMTEGVEPQCYCPVCMESPHQISVPPDNRSVQMRLMDEKERDPEDVEYGYYL